jgi:hypothetical protein
VKAERRKRRCAGLDRRLGRYSAKTINFKRICDGQGFSARECAFTFAALATPSSADIRPVMRPHPRMSVNGATSREWPLPTHCRHSTRRVLRFASGWRAPFRGQSEPALNPEERTRYGAALRPLCAAPARSAASDNSTSENAMPLRRVCSGFALTPCRCRCRTTRPSRDRARSRIRLVRADVHHRDCLGTAQRRGARRAGPPPRDGYRWPNLASSA